MTFCFIENIPEHARCTFENGTCGWTHVPNVYVPNEPSHYIDEEFDWTRHKGHSPTSGTGPSVDHTLGTEKG